jgi:hypothetical protein
LADLPDNEMKFHFGPRDFLGQFKLEGLTENEPEINLEIMNRYVKCLVLSRLLILERIIDGISPFNWLFFQLKESTDQSIFTEMSKIVKHFKLKDLDTELKRIRDVLATKINAKRLACI